MKVQTFPHTLPIQRVHQRTIAEQAGVSISTVSRVLNNASGISDELRRHVLTVATEMGYYDSVPSSRLQHIDLFSSMFNNGTDLDTFHSDILCGVESECRRHDIQLSYSMIEQVENRTAFILRKMKEHQVEGMLLASINERELIEQLLKRNPLMAVINTDYHDLPVDSFLPDNFTGALQATRHLLAYGHQRILHITAPTEYRSNTLQRRFDGYYAALQEAGIAFDPSLLLECTLDVKDAQTALLRFLTANKFQFTSIFCANDASAIGALRTLQETGKRVPEDISVIGFDDIPTAALLTPALTTMRIDCKEMGILATRRLIDRYLRPDATPVRVEIATQLISRQSVGPAKF